MDLQKKGLEYLHRAEDVLVTEPTDDHHRKTQRDVAHLQLALATTYFLASIARGRQVLCEKGVLEIKEACRDQCTRLAAILHSLDPEDVTEEQRCEAANLLTAWKVRETLKNYKEAAE